MFIIYTRNPIFFSLLFRFQVFKSNVEYAHPVMRVREFAIETPANDGQIVYGSGNYIAVKSNPFAHA
jgi:hypothetical protein